MRVIDADTHIDETEDTWAWLEEHEKQFIPTTDAPKELDPNRPPTRYWLIDGHLDEDLPYILQYATEDNLVVGSDYTHADASMEMDFPKLLQARADSGEIPPTAVQKILYDNAKTLYGL
jgi:hypothetical protein